MSLTYLSKKLLEKEEATITLLSGIPLSTEYIPDTYISQRTNLPKNWRSNIALFANIRDIKRVYDKTSPTNIMLWGFVPNKTIRICTSTKIWRQLILK